MPFYHTLSSLQSLLADYERFWQLLLTLIPECSGFEWQLGNFMLLIYQPLI